MFVCIFKKGFYRPYIKQKIDMRVSKFNLCVSIVLDL